MPAPGVVLPVLPDFITNIEIHPNAGFLYTLRDDRLPRISALALLFPQ
jgi:hypothetical protein